MIEQAGNSELVQSTTFRARIHAAANRIGGRNNHAKDQLLRLTVKPID